MRYIIIFILFFSSYVAEAQKVDYTLYEDDKCSFLYPSHWKTEKFYNNPTVLYKLDITELKTDSLDKAPEIIIFYETELLESMEVEDIVNIINEQHKKKYNNEIETTVKKVNEDKYEYESIYMSKKYFVKLYNKSIFYLHDDIVYVMGFTYELEKEKEYKPIMKKVFKSFKIK